MLLDITQHLIFGYHVTITMQDISRFISIENMNTEMEVRLLLIKNDLHEYRTGRAPQFLLHQYSNSHLLKIAILKNINKYKFKYT